MIEKGKPQKVQFSFRLVLVNYDSSIEVTNLSFLSRKSKALSMIGVNNQNNLLIVTFKLNIQEKA